MNLIFDFDGTLCDSLSTNIKIANKYLRLAFLKPTSVEELRKIGLKGLVESRHIPKFTLLFASPFLHWEFSRHLPHLSLFPWTKEVIPALSQKHKLSVLTNNSIPVVSGVLKRHNLYSYFNFIHSESGLFSKHNSLVHLTQKHDLIPSDTYYIGDSLRDIEAAHKIGLKSIGVTWGFESDELLASANPTKLISNSNQLLSIS